MTEIVCPASYRPLELPTKVHSRSGQSKDSRCHETCRGIIPVFSRLLTRSTCAFCYQQLSLSTIILSTQSHWTLAMRTKLWLVSEEATTKCYVSR